MIREEAYNRIDAIIAKHEIDDEYVAVTNEKDYDALRLYRKVIEQEPCEDCISRAELIDKTIKRNSIWLKVTDSRGMNLQEIIDELSSVQPKTEWIPVSERLPEDRDWYLGIFKEPDTGWISPLPFICDYVGHKTKATTKEHWILHGFTDRDEHIDYYFNLECVAWMPLPEPYKAESEDKE